MPNISVTVSCSDTSYSRRLCLRNTHFNQYLTIISNSVNISSNPGKLQEKLRWKLNFNLRLVYIIMIICSCVEVLMELLVFLHQVDTKNFAVVFLLQSSQSGITASHTNEKDFILLTTVEFGIVSIEMGFAIQIFGFPML